MNVGPACSVINSNNATERTTTSTPEAVWYQETASTSCEDDAPSLSGSGFFVSLLQRWDLLDRNRVYYQIFPFPNANSSQLLARRGCHDGNDSENTTCNEKMLESGPMYTVRLPRQLALIEEKPSEEEEQQQHPKRGVNNKSSQSTTTPSSSSPRMQERRVPLMVRLSDHLKLLVLQFSPTHVRIVKPDQIENAAQTIFGPERSPNQNNNNSKEQCQHWTVELRSSAKDPYAPVSSPPDEMPAMRPVAANNKHSAAEVILPGGVFLLDPGSDESARRKSDVQEFMLVLVTTKSVLCYRATLNRLDGIPQAKLSVSLAHVFSHPPACVAWWTPKVKVLVVGSYQEEDHNQGHHHVVPTSETKQYQNQRLFLRTYFFSGRGPPLADSTEAARNPLFLPIRVEHPLPVRFPAFVVGSTTSAALPALEKGESSSRTQSQVAHSLCSTTTMNSNASLLKKKAHRYPVAGIGVVQLYKETFIVEIGAESFHSIHYSGNHCLDITLHRLDTEKRRVELCHLQQRVVVPKRIHTSKENVLVVALDDLLCITFRRSKFHVFLDIMDAGSDSSYVIEKLATQGEHDFLQSHPALFIPPSFLFSPTRGEVAHLELDLERLAPSIANCSRSSFSILLRRKQPGLSAHTGREIALARFMAVGALPLFEQRLEWIKHVAVSYSIASSHCSGNTKQLTPLHWDLEATLPLLFRCALLPAGSEFLEFNDQHDAYQCSPLQWHGAHVNRLRKPVSNAVLFQKDILEQILLPQATKVLRQSNNKGNKMHAAQVLRRVAEVAVSYIGALECHGTLPCAALECFAFAILWRLGSAQEILALLTSRSRRENFFRDSQRRPRNALYSGIAQLASMIMAVIENVAFGSLSFDTATRPKLRQVSHLHRRLIFRESLSILSSRTRHYEFPGALIRHLLRRKRVLDAMLVGGMLLESTDAATDNYGTALHKPNTSALIYARRQNAGDDFVQAALEQYLYHGSRAQHDRLIQSLSPFLGKWDSLYLRRCSSIQLSEELQRQAMRDDYALPARKAALPSSSAKKRLSRRPSWVAMFVIESRVW